MSRFVVEGDGAGSGDDFGFGVLVEEREDGVNAIGVEESGGGVETLGGIEHHFGPESGQRVIHAFRGGGDLEIVSEGQMLALESARPVNTFDGAWVDGGFEQAGFDEDLAG